jgi:hypothetical protein
MRRQGTPESATTYLFNTLQEVTNQVRMVHGDKDIHFGGQDVVPMYGICQGIGAGPPMWAVVTTPILDLICSKAIGSS